MLNTKVDEKMWLNNEFKRINENFISFQEQMVGYSNNPKRNGNICFYYTANVNNELLNENGTNKEMECIINDYVRSYSWYNSKCYDVYMGDTDLTNIVKRRWEKKRYTIS